MTENNRPVDKEGKGAQLWLVAGVILLGIVLLGVWLKVFRKDDSKTEEAQQTKAVLVSTMKIEARQIADRITLPGVVLPIREAVLSTEKGGRITKLAVDKGDKVSAGSVVARLDDRTWKAQEKEASIQEREARNDLVRWEALKKSGAVSDDDYEAIKARLDLASVAKEAASVFVSQCSIEAPFKGIINDRYVNEGEYAAEGIPVFKLTDISRIKIAINIPERDICSVSRGDNMEFRFAAIPGRSFTGTVSFVSEQADRLSNAFGVELIADNEDGAVKAGMIAKVDFTRRVLDSAIVIPLVSIVPQKGDDVVYVVRDGRAVRRVVRIDSWFESDALVASGLDIGEEIIIAGQKSVQDGMTVDVEGGEPAAGPDDKTTTRQEDRETEGDSGHSATGTGEQ